MSMKVFHAAAWVLALSAVLRTSSGANVADTSRQAMLGIDVDDQQVKEHSMVAAPIVSNHHEDHHEEHGGPAHGHGHDDHGHAAHGHDDHHDAHHDPHGPETKSLDQKHHATSNDHHHHAPASSEAKSVALGLIGAVVLIPMVLYMALGGGVLSELTLRMLDTFVSIFLAVLWFNTFNQFMITFEVKSMFAGAVEIVSFVQVLVLYAIANGVAYLWRDKTIHLTTFCVCGAHFIAFAGIGASAASQETFSEVGDEWELPMSWGFCFAVVGVIMAISLTNHFAWRNKVEHERMNEAIDELELDILGLVVSFLITQAVRQSITGRYPPLHFMMFLQGGEEALSDAMGHFKHKPWQIWFMLFWSVGLSILTAVMLPYLSRIEHSGSYWAHKGIHVIKVILVMCTAWGFLLWGDWAFFEMFFKGDPMFGRMVFACLSTLICLATLVGLAYVQGKFISHGQDDDEESESISIVTAGISLVAAWSWEHTFNVAFNIVGQEFQVGYKGLVPKLFLAVVIPLALLPTYVVHIRTRVVALSEERAAKHEHGHGHGHAAHDAVDTA